MCNHIVDCDAANKGKKNHTEPPPPTHTHQAHSTMTDAEEDCGLHLCAVSCILYCFIRDIMVGGGWVKGTRGFPARLFAMPDALVTVSKLSSF